MIGTVLGKGGMDTGRGGSWPSRGHSRRKTEELACAKAVWKGYSQGNAIARLACEQEEGVLGALYSGWECLDWRIPHGKGWAGQTWAGWEEENCALGGHSTTNI